MNATTKETFIQTQIQSNAKIEFFYYTNIKNNLHDHHDKTTHIPQISNIHLNFKHNI